MGNNKLRRAFRSEDRRSSYSEVLATNGEYSYFSAQLSTRCPGDKMAVLEIIVGALLLVDAAVVRAAAVPAAPARAPAKAVPMNTSLTDALAAKAHANLASYVAAKGYPKQNCTLENAAVRKEW